MRRILLVDDEFNIRKGLRALIERADTAFGEIEECENGRDALDRLSEKRFDLAVVDIKMPYMDGLALIRESQKLADKPKFIILSGYDDFSYAKTAIKYGVDEYLLKPVDMAEMLEALKKVESGLKREEKLAEDIDKANCLAGSLRRHELSYLFSRENLTEQEMINSVKAIHVDIFDDQYYISSVHCDGRGKKEEPDCRCLSARCSGPALTFSDMKGNLVAVMRQKPDLDRLLQYFGRNADGYFAVGVSNVGSGIGDIRKCYLQASEALKYRILKPPEPAIITYTEIEGRNMDFTVPLDSITKIPQMISAFKTEEAGELLNRLFDKEVLSNYPIAYVSELAESIYQNVIGYFMQTLPSKSGSFEKQYGCLKDIYHFNRLPEYLHMLGKCLSDISACLTALRDNNAGGDVIDAAIAYIYDNYNKNLNMAVGANYVSLNYSYFSSLFSERTGLNFAEYLKKVRIENAKELLSKTDAPVKVVSKKVGFKNARHFARVFKDLTGILPMEYRKSIFRSRIP